MLGLVRSGSLGVMLVLCMASPALASTLYGSIAWTTLRGIGNQLSQQPEGALVTVDLASLGVASVPSGFSNTPGGTTLVADVFTLPGGNTYLTGLAATGGSLYASTFECFTPSCFEGPSRLLEIDPTTGAAVDIGIIRHGTTELSIYDLAVHPTTGEIYGISTFLGTNCVACLYTIDRNTAAATLIGGAAIGLGLPGGLAFGSNGELYLTTVSPIAGPFSGTRRNPLDFVVLDPATGQIVSREDLLLEQQFIVRAGNVSTLITSIVLQGLEVLPGGRIVAVGDNGNTMMYERVFGQARDPNGNPVGPERFVWRLLGDSGENVSDLAYLVPEPHLGLLLAGALFVMGLRRCKRN